MRKFTTLSLCLMLAGLLGCSALGGKVETSFTETVTDADGLETTTAYKAVSKAGMFGQLDTSSHTFRYDFGEKENTIASGQDAMGQDNTGNQVAAAMFAELLGVMVQQMGAIKAQELAMRAAIAEAQIAAGGQSAPWIEILNRVLAMQP